MRRELTPQWAREEWARQLGYNDHGRIGERMGDLGWIAAHIPRDEVQPCLCMVEQACIFTEGNDDEDK